MSINLGNAADNTWKRIRLQHVTLAAGIALAVGSAVAIGGWQSDGVPVPPSAHPRHTSEAPAGRSADPPQVVFFIASEQAQVDRALALEEEGRWIRYELGLSEPRRSVVVLMARTPEEEAAAQGKIAGAMAAANFTADTAPSFQVVDLR